MRSFSLIWCIVIVLRCGPVHLLLWIALQQLTYYIVIMESEVEYSDSGDLSESVSSFKPDSEDEGSENGSETLLEKQKTQKKKN